jgi:hypothetical protein
MKVRLLIKNIYEFYRYRCCWPYSLSFFLVLGIFWLDFFVVRTRYHWTSLFAYGIIAAYYLRVASLCFNAKIRDKISGFSFLFLSFKIILWGLILTVLYLWKKP